MKRTTIPARFGHSFQFRSTLLGYRKSPKHALTRLQVIIEDARG